MHYVAIETYNWQVSDALLKIQKVPKGETARAGFLADLGESITTPQIPMLASNVARSRYRALLLHPLFKSCHKHILY